MSPTPRPPVPAVLYRVEDNKHDEVDETSFFRRSDRNFWFPVRTYPVIRATRCGVWIDDMSTRGKFVNLQAGKRYAAPTIEEALQSYKARKRRQVSILSAQLKRATAMLRAAHKACDNPTFEMGSYATIWRVTGGPICRKETTP